MAIHLDTNHLHNHLVVNSVSCKDSKKLHQNAADLQQHRQMMRSTPWRTGCRCWSAKKHTRKKQMRPARVDAGLRGDGWKRISSSHQRHWNMPMTGESFVENMGYEVIWTDTRKLIYHALSV